MPSVAFNIGKETTLVLMSPTTGPISFGLLTNFDSRPMTQRLQSVPITNNGESQHRVIYIGWEGNFEVDRSDNLVDVLFQALEDNYYAGSPETYFLITETIRNPDGTIEEYRYRNVVLVLDTHGNWRGEEKVTQRFTFVASRRERV